VSAALFFPGVGPVAASATLQNRVWNHLAITAKPGRIRFYVNGQLQATGTTMYPTLARTGSTLALMRLGNFQYVGELDNLGVWSRELTGAEVQSVMNTPLTAQDRLGDACDPFPSNPDRTCAPTTCLDRDGDGYGVQGASACAGGVGQLDCNDGDAATRPGAVEVCDGVDNNCDGRVDENCLQGAQRTVYSYNAFNQLLAYGPPRVCPAGDADCDGVPDTQDNCPLIANAGQQNSDGDQPNANGAGATALWSFNEGSGTTAAEATGHYNGTLVGSPQWVTGYAGKALDFGGVSGRYVSETTLPGPSAPYTLEAKIKITTASGVLTRWGNLGPMWSMSAGGTSVAFMNGQGTVPTGRWVHVAFTFDGTVSRYYQDGQQVASVNDHPWSSGERPLKIGDGLSGAMDEVAVFPRVLTPQEVQHHAEGLFGDKLGDACDPCPNSADPTCAPTTCIDHDGDGFGPQGASACGGPVDKFDCDDGNAGNHPGVRDVCDGVDNDCDGIVDEDCPTGPAAVTLSYDANGNQTHKVNAAGNPEYVFDARDRLVEIKQGGATVARYGYDTQNLRVYVNDAGGERRVLVDGAEEIAEYEAGAMSRIGRYDHDPSQPDRVVGQVTGGKAHAAIDALGSVYALVQGSTAAVQARYSYDSFGARTAASETIASPWGFTGRRLDPTGQIYYRARYYATDVGLFSARDPLAAALPGYFPGTNDGVEILRQMQEGYSYVLSSPTNRVDPSGYIFGFGLDVSLILDLAEQNVLYPLTLYFEENVAATMGWECAPCRAAFAEAVIYSEKTIGRRIPLAMNGWDPRNGKYFPRSDYGHRIALAWDLALLELSGITMVRNCYLFEHKELGVWYMLIGGIDASRYTGGGTLGNMN
jgi:RHS repeat-associated protein